MWNEGDFVQAAWVVREPGDTMLVILFRRLSDRRWVVRATNGTSTISHAASAEKTDKTATDLVAGAVEDSLMLGPGGSAIRYDIQSSDTHTIRDKLTKAFTF